MSHISSSPLDVSSKGIGGERVVSLASPHRWVREGVLGKLSGYFHWSGTNAHIVKGRTSRRIVFTIKRNKLTWSSPSTTIYRCCEYVWAFAAKVCISLCALQSQCDRSTVSYEPLLFRGPKATWWSVVRAHLTAEKENIRSAHPRIKKVHLHHRCAFYGSLLVCNLSVK